jgi:hypothetical protein
MKPDSRTADALRDSLTTTFLVGGGEMGALIRAHDWNSTSLGAPENWPQGLKTAIRIMLTSRQPIWIGWGPELLFFYNDPYKSASIRSRSVSRPRWYGMKSGAISHPCSPPR